jgi:hypothetical protein
MTLLHAPTGNFSTKRTILFTDFVTGVSPYGSLLSTTAAGTSTIAISNSSDGEFGTAVVTLPASSTSPLRSRAAIMLCRSAVGTGTIVQRQFRIYDFEEASFSTRIKTNISANAMYCAAGFPASHATTDNLAEQLIGFIVRGTEPTWAASIVVDNVEIFRFVTSVPKTSYSVLSVFVRRDLRRIDEQWIYVEFFADGKLVAKWNGSVGNMFIAGTQGLPGIEARDKNDGGSGVAGQSFTVDFIEFYGSHGDRT